MAPAPPPPRAKEEDPLAAIFDAVDVGGSAEARREATGASSLLEGLLAGIVGRPGERKTGVAEALRIAEGALAAEVTQVLADPRFRQLESAWLGLRFLVRRIDFRAGIHLHVLPAPAAELTRAIREVVLPHIDPLREEGRSVVVLADFDLEDRAALLELARELEAASLPLVASASPRLFDLGSAAELLESTDLVSFQTMAAWAELRKEPATRWIALGVNSLLARPPFGSDGETVKGLAFQEQGAAWMRPSWAIAERIAAAAARTGWALDCVGAGEGGRVDDLPLKRRATRTGDDVALPTEAMISEQRLLDLSRLGLVPLAARRNDDHAFVATAPLVFAPARGTDDRANQMNARRATLPYQLMVNQITTLVRQVYPHLERTSPFEIARTLGAGLRDLTLSRRSRCFAIEVTSPRRGGRTPRHVDPLDAAQGADEGLPDLSWSCRSPDGPSGRGLIGYPDAPTEARHHEPLPKGTAMSALPWKLLVIADLGLSAEEPARLPTGEGWPEGIAARVELPLPNERGAVDEAPRLPSASLESFAPASIRRVNRRGLRRAVRGADRRGAAPAFQRVESAWRGLLLRARARRRSTLVFFLVAREVARRFQRGVSRWRSRGARSSSTSSATRGGFRGADPRSRAPSPGAEVPLIAGGGPGLFDLRYFAHVPAIPNVVDRVSDAPRELAPTRRARTLVGSRSPSIAISSAPPIGVGTTRRWRRRSPSFLFGRGSWLVGAAIARSVAAWGHALDIAGAGRPFDGLPTRLYPQAIGGRDRRSPGAPFPEMRAMELTRAGVSPLVGVLSRLVVLSLVNTTAPTHARKLTLEALLAYRLTAGRLGQFCDRLLDRQSSGASNAEEALRLAGARGTRLRRSALAGRSPVAHGRRGRSRPPATAARSRWRTCAGSRASRSRGRDWELELLLPIGG
ncbi:MAG: type VI secretion system contractile sheath large subunit [Candidatus Eisenbacteria bacterium]